MRRALVLGGTLLAMATPQTAEAARPSAGAAHPQNAASAVAYLRAQLEYEQAFVADASNIRAAADQYVEQLKRECLGALSGAEALQNLEASTTRAFGEQALAREQLEILGEELSVAVERAAYAAARQAGLSFLRAVQALHWEDRQLGAALLAGAQRSVTALQTMPQPICADAQAWVASGHRRLSEDSRAFVAEREAGQRTRQSERPDVIERSLKLYAAGRGRALELAAKRLRGPLARLYEAIQTSTADARVTTGLRSEAVPGLREKARRLGTATPLGRGRTSVGETFDVNVRHAAPHTHECRLQIQVVDFGAHEQHNGVCLGPGTRSTPTVRCEEQERWIEALLPAGVHAARLRLSDGRQITSSTIAIPARLGGPAALYYQAVARGHGVPRSLTELDRTGAALATIALPSASRCVRHGVHFLPDGIVPLAHGSTPGGPQFTIKGEAYAYNGPVHFSMSVELEGAGGGGENLSGTDPRLLMYAAWSHCYPQTYELVYGVLKQRGDAVSVRTPSGVTALTQASIPARLHAGGTLVYGVFTSPPQSMVVNDPSGQTVLTENLAGASSFRFEYCEGAVEPGRPPREEGSLFAVGD